MRRTRSHCADNTGRPRVPPTKVRLTLTHAASTGRNFDETLRVIDSLQLTDGHNVATPVNWQQGDDVIVSPKLSDEDAAELFPAGFTTVKPHLRTTAQPNCSITARGNLSSPNGETFDHIAKPAWVSAGTPKLGTHSAVTQYRCATGHARRGETHE